MTTPLNEGTVPAAVPADQRAVMQQAVSALEALLAGTDKTVSDRQKGRAAIVVLRAALATSAPPPVEAREPATPSSALRNAAYDQIDRYLRNNLSDEDYADYSQALDLLWLAATHPKEPTTEGREQ